VNSNSSAAPAHFLLRRLCVRAATNNAYCLAEPRFERCNVQEHKLNSRRRLTKYEQTTSSKLQRSGTLLLLSGAVNLVRGTCCGSEAEDKGHHQTESGLVSLFPPPAIRDKLQAVSVITLTTDFGTGEWFVGTMKGVILRIQPRATVVDITHGIPAGDIRAGAFALAAGCRFFPKGTVHVVVVDPGVGSTRKAIAVQTADHFFVGPDNGVLSWALAEAKIRAVHALENEAYFLHPVSQTFHGRDIFGPVAAHLSRGVLIRKLGPPLKDFVRLDWPAPRRRRGGIEGEVIHIDRFGNAITNLEDRLLRGTDRAVCEIRGKHRRRCPVKPFYQAAAPGSAVALVGSSGFLEIAVNGGSAAKALGLRIGTRLVLRAD
jgi:S-adenosyl-L-methionine hydrolase (adenosine-forming)